jgi:hypothetical protein
LGRRNHTVYTYRSAQEAFQSSKWTGARYCQRR